MNVRRFAENPLITPADVKPTRDDFEVICVFNPGVIRYDGETLLLMRVAERPKNDDPNVVIAPVANASGDTPSIDVLRFSCDDPLLDCRDKRVMFREGQAYLTSISHLRIARSKDGVQFEIDDELALAPDRPSESFGLEDPRITEIDGQFYIVYKSVSENGITQSLATTRDFRTFEKRGIILPPENMDAMIFPERIGGRYAALHRPFPHMIGRPNIWVAYSEDGLHWGDHRFLAGVQPSGWEGGRIGGGAVPFMTEQGWLAIYHGATPGDVYSIGAMLLEADRPHQVIARSERPILSPEMDYEEHGFVSNVVFTCGAIVEGDTLTVYYGAADTVIAGAQLSVREILKELE